MLHTMLQIMHRSLMELPHDKRQKVVQMLSHIKQQQIQAKLRQQQQDGTSANGLPPSGRGVSPAPQANGMQLLPLLICSLLQSIEQGPAFAPRNVLRQGSCCFTPCKPSHLSTACLPADIYADRQTIIPDNAQSDMATRCYSVLVYAQLCLVLVTRARFSDCKAARCARHEQCPRLDQPAADASFT